MVAQAAINKVIEPGLESLYAAIRARAVSSAPQQPGLIVLGYPDFFAGNLLCVTSDSSEQAAINKTIDVLDNAIAKAASATTGTTFVDVRPAFATHELCSQTPWLSGLILSNPVTSFHPNQAGQAQGYESALTAATG